MRKMPEIKAENGFVTSIDGNAIPRMKLYAHYIVLSDSQTDNCYTFLIDDNPTSYNTRSLKEKHPNLKIPCYGIRMSNGKVYQYTEFNISFGSYIIGYARANLETNEIDSYSVTPYGSAVQSDYVAPLN